MIGRPQQKALSALKTTNYLLLCIVGAAFAFGPIAASAACVSHRLKSIDLRAKLGDGAHIVDLFATGHGRLEERVVVIKGVVSKPSFFLDNRRLRKTSKGELPRRVLTCLKGRAHGAGGANRARGCTVAVKEVWSECFTVAGERTCTYVVEISDCGKFSHYEVW